MPGLYQVGGLRTVAKSAHGEGFSLWQCQPGGKAYFGFQYRWQLMDLLAAAPDMKGERNAPVEKPQPAQPFGGS